jgi:hypothetical protein
MMNRLEKIATVTLKKHNGDIEKACPDFLRAVRVEKLVDELATVYLRQVVGREEGHGSLETHSAGVGLTPPILGSIKVREHDVRQHRRRTQAEKEAARETMLRSAEAVYDLSINGRAIGNIRVGELTALKHELVDDASHWLMHGLEQARNAILAELIEGHCVVQDTLTRIRDVVDAKTLSEFVEQANEEAPRRVNEGMRRAAEAIDHNPNSGEIAA